MAELELPLRVLRQSLSMLGLVAGLACGWPPKPHNFSQLQQSSSSSSSMDVGELALESTLETRLMQRVNDYGP